VQSIVNKKNPDPVTINFKYEIRNLLREVSAESPVFIPDLGEVASSAEYDYRGMRTKRLSTAGEVHYTYDEDSVLVEFDKLSNWVAKYEYGNELILMQHKTEGELYYYYDHFGSVVNLGDASGRITASYLCIGSP
jgi:hypothetical protein